MMNLILNILWFIFCGFWQWVSWALAGTLWCLSIIGIPVGLQCYKFAGLVAMPFGKQVVYSSKVSSMILNVLWIILSGIPLAVAAVGNGILLCLTIIGIPFGLQCFKFAGLALMPFGAQVVKS